MQAVRTALAAGVLAGPPAIALASGGYFERERLIAAIAAWALCAAAALTVSRPLPRSRELALALGGLLALAGLTALSLAWTPDPGAAFEDSERLLLYAGALIAATALLGGRDAEPWLLAGAAAIVLYALGERLLPWLLEYERSFSAGGRLHQPLTYWNGLGALAAFAIALAAGVAGDTARGPRVRAAAMASVPAAGALLALTLSRGAIAAAGIGLLTVLALRADRGQLRTVVAAALAAAAGAAAAAVLADGGTVDLADGERSARGLALLATLLLAGGAATFALRDDRTAMPAVRRLAPLAAVLALVALAGAIAVSENRSPDPGAGRLASADSSRYAYWEVAAKAFADHPLTGTGAGGFRVEWLRERPFRETVRDAHSLPAETAAELGLLGLIALAAMIAGVAPAARRRPATGGALAAWGAQACIDWSWELPGLTAFALVAAGAALARVRSP